jgi:uncharacterized membrane protein
MVELIGHFHPLFVHLPIGILLLAILFELLPSKKRYRSLKRSILTILVIGSVSAVMSCITGYLLSQSGDYESEAVGWHQWIAIILTIYAVGYAWMRDRKEYKSYRKMFAFVLLILLMITGHLGGSLTHGEGYLSAGFGSTSGLDLTKVNLEQAIFYEDLAKPVMEQRCYGCHGSSRQKGKLRLDAPEHILKGGKDGKVLIAGRTDESEMINRMLLPLDDEDHMPPKEKPQPSAQEIEILKIWIASGADFKKSLKDAGQLAAVKKIISSKNMVTASDVPTGEIKAADQNTLNKLTKLGVVLIPVASNSNYLSANMINVTALDSAVDLLTKIKEQLIWLKTSSQPITDNHLSKLVQLEKLTRLTIDHAQITDAGLSLIASLTQLQYLNLNGNHITAAGLAPLKALADLKSIYLYQTQIRKEELASIKNYFPNSVIESGDYSVPLLPSDTTEARAPIVKNAA